MPSSSRHVIARRVTVEGRVQGVAFRWATREKALELGLSGWVKNKRTGSVEVHLEGREEVLAEMLEWLGRGPRMARVQAVHPSEVPAEGLHSFEILQTAD